MMGLVENVGRCSGWVSVRSLGVCLGRVASSTGLDPHNRNQVWKSVRALAAAGSTVLLTTQYLEEADQLAVAICILKSGRAIATRSPSHIKAADRRRPHRHRAATGR